MSAIRPYVRWSRERVAKVDAMKADGMRYADIAERWGMTVHGLRSIYNRHKRQYAAEDAAAKQEAPE